MKIIDKLDAEQVARMGIVRDKWIDIGLKTGRCNRTEVERLIGYVYEAAELDPPKDIIWAESPMSGAIIYFMMNASVMASVRDSVWASVRDSVGDSVRDSVWDSVMASVWDSVGSSVMASVGDSVMASVWDSVRDSVWASVRDSVRDSVWDSVRASVRASVWASVRDSVWDSVRASVRDSVWDSVWNSVLASVMASVRDSVGSSVGDSVYKSGYGQHDANWLAFYDYFSEYLSCVDKLKPLIDFSKHVGWWWPLENAVIISERPISLTMDDEGRLHHESKMAIEYEDGWGVYSWHGVRLPGWVIEEPENITPDIILQEDNQEIRRVMLERYGWDRLLLDIGAKTEHKDSCGELVSTEKLGEYLDGEDSVAKFVLVDDPSTDRRYALRVPPDTKTARGGVAWTFCQDEETYHPVKEA